MELYCKTGATANTDQTAQANTNYSKCFISRSVCLMKCEFKFVIQLRILVRKIFLPKNAYLAQIYIF